MQNVKCQIKIKCSNLIIFVFLFLIFPSILLGTSNFDLQVFAAGCGDISCSKDDLTCINEKKSCWEEKIKDTRNQQVTLANTISILENQIYVQELEIEKTEAELRQLNRELQELSDRLSGLEVSLDELSTILIKRVQEDYKRRRSSELQLSLLSPSLNKLITQFKYLKKAQQHVSQLLRRAEEQRLDYDAQKQLKEDKQAEEAAKQAQLSSQKADLDNQKYGQEVLLVETKHSESRYQNELAKTLAELEAIQSIIAGKGAESEVGGVNQGESIASIITGASYCSTGTHLHFEVVKDGAHRNPADKLKGTDIVWSNSPDGSFGFSGSWDWPVGNAARITQGYGMTWYASVKRAYGGAPHTGIDMLSKSSGDYKIKAVKNGTLYRGSIPCGGGLLRYVKVEHSDDGYSTYYLHVNY